MAIKFDLLKGAAPVICDVSERKYGPLCKIHEIQSQILYNSPSNSTTGNYLKLLWSMLLCLKYKQDYKSPHLNNNLVQSDIASTWDRQIKSVVFGAWKATVVFSSRNNSKTEPGVARNKTS